MATKLDVEKMKYLRSFDEVQSQYEKFKNENVNRKSPLELEVHTIEPVEVYIAVSDFIHSAAVLIETGIDETRISGKSRSFISAIRYVDNLLKHEKGPIDIEELLSSTPKMSGNVKKTQGVSFFKIGMELVSFWKEIPARIPIDPRNMNQKNNYDLYLKNKELMSAIDVLDKIVRKYITFDIS